MNFWDLPVVPGNSLEVPHGSPTFVYRNGEWWEQVKEGRKQVEMNWSPSDKAFMDKYLSYIHVTE